LLDQKEVLNKEQSSLAITSEKPLLNLEEAAEYLHLSASEIKHIITSEKIQLNTTGSFTGIMFPNIKIGWNFILAKMS